MERLPVLTAENPCGECRVCCEHWAISSSMGADFDKIAGKLCSFWAGGCSRQNDKPLVCQSYDCAYASCQPSMRLLSARPDQSHMLPYWDGSELCIRVLGDEFKLNWHMAQMMDNQAILDYVRAPLDAMLPWAYSIAASRCGQLSVFVHGRRVMTSSAADVLAKCFEMDYPVELDRRYVSSLRTFPCPAAKKDPWLIQPGEEWQQVSADLQVKFVAYRVMYGYRLRAGEVRDRLGYTLDWGLGPNEPDSREFQYAFKAMLKMVDDNWRNHKPHFYRIPQRSQIKPIFRDPDFVSRVFQGVDFDSTIVEVGPNVSDDQVDCVYKSRRASCKCSWCGKKRGEVKHCVMTAKLRSELRSYAKEHGSRWRSLLSIEWAFGSSNHSELRQIRNKIGPTVMTKIPKSLLESS